VCHRTEAWQDSIPFEEHEKCGGSFAAAKKRVYEETKLQYQAIILAKDSLDDVKKTVKSLLAKGPGLAPRQLTIICLGGSKLWNDVALQKFCMELKIAWRVENAAHFDMTYDKMIDIVIDMKPQPYYAVFHAGHEVDTRVFSKISNMIVHELEPITVLAPENNNGLFVNSFVHKVCGGNAGKPILEKLKEQDKNIQSIGEVCESV
jgi:hypothetical protein